MVEELQQSFAPFNCFLSRAVVAGAVAEIQGAVSTPGALVEARAVKLPPKYAASAEVEERSWGQVNPPRECQVKDSSAIQASGTTVVTETTMEDPCCLSRREDTGTAMVATASRAEAMVVRAEAAAGILGGLPEVATVSGPAVAEEADTHRAERRPPGAAPNREQTPKLFLMVSGWGDSQTEPISTPHMVAWSSLSAERHAHHDRLFSR